MKYYRKNQFRPEHIIIVEDRTPEVWDEHAKHYIAKCRGIGAEVDRLLKKNRCAVRHVWAKNARSIDYTLVSDNIVNDLGRPDTVYIFKGICDLKCATDVAKVHAVQLGRVLI